MKKLLSIGLLLAIGGQTQANAPLFSWGPPPKVMGCEILGTYQQVRNCLRTEVNGRVDTAVENAQNAHQNAIDNLNQQHAAAMNQLHAQLQQLQEELANQSQNAQQGGQQMMQQLTIQTTGSVNAVTGALNQMSGPLLQLQSCLAGKGVSLEQLLLTDGAASIQRTQSELQAVWNTVLSNAARYPAVNVDPRNPPSINQLLQRAEVVAGQVADVNPISSCMWQQTAGLRAQARQTAATMLPAILDQFNQALDQVAKPMAQQAMNEIIEPMLRNATGLAARTGGQITHAAARQAMSSLPDDVRRQVFALVHDRLLNRGEMIALVNAVNTHAVSLIRGDSQRSLGEVRTSIDRARGFTDEEAVLIGVEVLKILGHEQIDSPEAQAKLANAIAWVLTLGNGVDGVVNAILGTASQPTTSITNFIVFCVEFVLNAHVSVAQWTITQASHVAWEQTMNVAAAQLGNASRGGAPSRRVRNAMGEFGDLLRHFPTEADLVVYTSPQLEQIRTDLFNYHGAVLKLAENAAGANSASNRTAATSKRTTSVRQAPSKNSQSKPTKSQKRSTNRTSQSEAVTSKQSTTTKNSKQNTQRTSTPKRTLPAKPPRT